MTGRMPDRSNNAEAAHAPPPARSRARWSGRRRSILLVLGLVTVVLATALGVDCPVGAGGPDRPNGAAPETDDRRNDVSALGRIEPDHGVIILGVPSTIESANGPILTKLMVEAGDNVEKGQVLAETDLVSLGEATVVVAEAELEVAEQQAEMAVGQEQEACSRAEVAKRTAARATSLLQKGATSSEEADVAEGDAKALSGTCASARIATKAAVSSVDLARARLNRAHVALERGYVRAPTDGRVLRIIKRPGEIVGAEGVLSMADISHMYAIAEVFETDIVRVHKGQKATVASKALDHPLTGTVDRIRPQVRKQDTIGTDPASRKDARIVEVEVLLDHPDAVDTLTNLQVEVLIHP